jgi:diguanylate cyclase (GGDEF)-like protein/PAS domain S-box-containing protein
VRGTYERTTARQDTTRQDEEQLDLAEITPVEAFPPSWILRDGAGKGRLVILQQVTYEESDWGLIAIGGERILQSSLVQETFQQCAILMSASLDQEKANADLARQAKELNTAYQTEMALLEEVRVSEERYALAAEASHDALWDWDIASGRVFYSSNWKALLGYHDNEVGTDPQEWLGRVHADDALMVREQVNRTLTRAKQFLDFEHRLKVAGGDYRWMACSGRSVADQDGKPSRLVGSITDVTVRKLLQDQLLQEALFDGLTGLAKNTMFKEKLSEAFERARQQPDYWFAVLFLDLDGFKAVNDNLGHAAGDELLASVAKRLKESLRKGDLAARLGGDEFAIILSDVDQVSELPLIVKRIQNLIRMPHQVGGQSANVGAAIGVAVSSSQFSSADEMLHEADSSMYRAKRRNKQAAAGLQADPVIRLTVDWGRSGHLAGCR